MVTTKNAAANAKEEDIITELPCQSYSFLYEVHSGGTSPPLRKKQKELVFFLYDIRAVRETAKHIKRKGDSHYVRKRSKTLY